MDDKYYNEFQDFFRGSRDKILDRLDIYKNILSRIQHFHGNNLPLIDLGCGRGEWLEILFNNNFKNIYGVDINEDALSKIKLNNCTLVKDDALNFLRKQKSNSCVIISGFHIIEHLKFNELLELLNESFRVLVDGGIILFETPNPKNMLVSTNSFWFDPTHNKPLPAELLNFIAQKAGFVDVNVVSINSIYKHKNAFDLNQIFYGEGLDNVLLAQKSSKLGILNHFYFFINKHYQHSSEYKISKLSSLLASYDADITYLKDKVRISPLYNMPTNFKGKLIRLLPKVVKNKIKFLRSFIFNYKNIVKKVSDRKRYLYIDISGIVSTDWFTGIQRTTKEIANNIPNFTPSDFQVVPVYGKNNDIGYFCSYCSLSPEDKNNLQIKEHSKIKPEPGDIFLGLDLQIDHTIKNNKYLGEMFKNNVQVYFTIYDILPSLYPHLFETHVQEKHSTWLNIITEFSGIFTISRKVLSDVNCWINENKKDVHSLSRYFISLGSDISENINKDINIKLITSIDHIPTNNSNINFLCVGTIEPRKNYDFIISAFEKLWEIDYQCNLTIVGKKGWKCKSLINRIITHEKFNKTLFWLNDVSDYQLKELYLQADTLIAASIDEGFGLPLVEAISFGTPIFCNDIEIFREVTKGKARFFNGDDIDAFSIDLKNYIDNWDPYILSDNEKKLFPSWYEASKELTKLIFD